MGVKVLNESSPSEELSTTDRSSEAAFGAKPDSKRGLFKSVRRQTVQLYIIRATPVGRLPRVPAPCRIRVSHSKRRTRLTSVLSCFQAVERVGVSLPGWCDRVVSAVVRVNSGYTEDRASASARGSTSRSRSVR